MATHQSIFQQLGIDRRAMVWLVVGTLAVGASYWLKNALGINVKQSVEKNAEPLVIVENASSLIFGTDKRIKYRIQADNATLFTQDVGTNFSNVSIDLFESGERAWFGKSVRANLSDDMKRLTFTESLTLSQVGDIPEAGAITFVADELQYDDVSGVISSDSTVEFSQGQRKLLGNTLHYDTRAKRLSLKNGVTTK